MPSEKPSVGSSVQKIRLKKKHAAQERICVTCFFRQSVYALEATHFKLKRAGFQEV